MNFLLSLCVMITSAYLFNLCFKYILHNATWKLKQLVIAGMLIFSGWLAMYFAVKGAESTLFDLRTIPIIFGTLIFNNPWLVFIISIGIAVIRALMTSDLTVALTGSFNIFLLGCSATALVYLYNRTTWSYRRKAAISILLINTQQMIGIAVLGPFSSYYYLTSIAPYTYIASNLLGAFFVFIIMDFYEEQLGAQKQKEMNFILRQQKRELEEKAQQLVLASKYKSEFIANMSHELKTPLNSIIALSELLQESRLMPEHQEEKSYADIIHASGNELLQMINNILDISKIDTGKLDIVWETISVAEIVQLINYQFITLIREKSLQFEVKVDDHVAVSFISDAQRLIQILRNLLTNAIKFTNEGTISIHVRMEEGVSCRYIVFSVQDTGIGIDTDKQQLIFEAFQQENGSFTRRYGGTGLGLSISLKLANLLGVSLVMTSKKGEGSCFTLSLPLQPPEPAVRH